MRGVAVASRVWSTAPMNIGSMTALNSARKDERAAAGAAGGWPAAAAASAAVWSSSSLTGRC